MESVSARTQFSITKDHSADVWKLGGTGARKELGSLLGGCCRWHRQRGVRGIVGRLGEGKRKWTVRRKKVHGTFYRSVIFNQDSASRCEEGTNL